MAWHAAEYPADGFEQEGDVFPILPGEGFIQKE